LALKLWKPKNPNKRNPNQIFIFPVVYMKPTVACAEWFGYLCGRVFVRVYFEELLSSKFLSQCFNTISEILTSCFLLSPPEYLEESMSML
jgi:hypothetical protein